MTTFLCIAFWLFAPILIFLALLGRLTESQPQRIRRLRRQGLSQRAIATTLGITTYRVRKAL